MCVEHDTMLHGQVDDWGHRHWALGASGTGLWGPQALGSEGPELSIPGDPQPSGGSRFLGALWAEEGGTL
ncbi:unnamed protein product [Boreogadus saida]